MAHHPPAGTQNGECLSAGGEQQQFGRGGNYFNKKPVTHYYLKICVSSETFDAFIQIGVNNVPPVWFCFHVARPLSSVCFAVWNSELMKCPVDRQRQVQGERINNSVPAFRRRV